MTVSSPADEAAGPEAADVPGPDADASPFERALWDAIDEIPDPHVPVSLVEMGMVYDVAAEDGAVAVEMTYPCLGCPAYDMIQDDVRGRLRAVDGVDDVAIDVVWEPAWSKRRLSAAVREKIRAAGTDV